MLAAALGLAPLLAQFIPNIVGWLGGDDAERIANQVVDVVQAVAGTTEPDAVAAVLQDPSRQAEIALGLARIAAEREAARDAAITARLQAAIADTAHARETTVRLVQAGSPISYLAPVVCGVIFALFAFVVIAEVFGAGAGLNEATRRLLDYLAIAAASYSIGSSVGSAAKDQRQAGVQAVDAAAGAAVRRFAGGSSR